MKTALTEAIHYHVVESPVGSLLLASDSDALRAIHFLGSNQETPSLDRVREMLRETIDLDPSAIPQEGGPIVNRTAEQLAEYFAGKRNEFALPLSPAGTEFQQRVWEALLRIPYSETWSYADLARAIGQPTASRAVGAANGKNPIPIVIPCHRVIGADGSLTGYGGGVDIKRALLELEGWGLFGGIAR